MIGLEEPVFAAVAAVERNPIHGTFSKFHLLAGVAGEADARDDGMLEARTHGRSCFVKIAAGEIFFKRSSAGDDAIEIHGGAGRRAGDLQLVRGGSQRRARQKKSGPKSEFQAGSHEGPLEEDDGPFRSVPKRQLTVLEEELV